MKRVLLIARAKTQGTVVKANVFADDVRHQLFGDGIEVENCEITELFFDVSQDKTAIYHPAKEFDLRDFDLVIMRHVGTRWVEAHAIGQYCEKYGIKYTDAYLNRLLPDSKLSNAFFLWCHGVTQWPRTMAGPSEELAMRLSELGGRAVLKDSDGSKGRLNFVVTTAQEVRDITRQYPDTQFIMQEFIPNEADYRILIMGGRVAMVIRRSGDGTSHLNNTSQGGSAEVVPIDQLPVEVVQHSVRAADLLKLQVAGVDIMFNSITNQWYFLEVNNAPQVSSGSFTQEKLVKYSDMIRSLLQEGSSAPERIIGIVEKVSIGQRAINVPAKIDTGADSSSIWATNIHVDQQGVLHFSLFGEGSEYYNGKLFRRTDFSVTRVKSSNGMAEVRYRTYFTVTIAGRKLKVLFNLADRSKNTYKILIGRRTIGNRFLVDVTKGASQLPEAVMTKQLERELVADPYKFHTKYVAKKKDTQS